MGNRVGGRRRPAVEERFTRPQGLYPHHDIDHKKLRRLILESKLAPCFPGDDDAAARPDLEECPICFLFYPSLNRSKCCTKGICTECFLQMKSPTSYRPTQCPYCKTANYAVEYRGVKTKEEKGIEQLEEQRVIEAQIRMQQQELQDDVKRMGKRQIAVSSGAVANPEVEYYDTGGVSNAVPGRAQGNEAFPLQVRPPELPGWSSTRLGQMRDNNFDMDLEEVMLMEAIWLSIQDQEALENPGYAGSVSPMTPSDRYDGLAVAPAEASSGGFACAVAALAEHQHKLGDSSAAATCSTSTYDLLHRSENSVIEDVSIVESSSSANKTDELSGSRKGGMREGGEYSINRWSEMTEASASCTVADAPVDIGAAALAFPNGSNIDSSHLPESFEEQMMLAMAVSLAEARARANSPGLTWL